MVEESAIDRMAHRNNAPLMLKGVLELDRAVQVALAFADQTPDTLIVVTADHECGGLAVAGSEDQPYPYEPGGGLLDTLLAGEDGPFPVADADYGFVLGWATTGHTAASVPISASGPGSELLSGSIENTDLFHAMARPWISLVRSARFRRVLKDNRPVSLRTEPKWSNAPGDSALADRRVP